LEIPAGFVGDLVQAVGLVVDNSIWFRSSDGSILDPSNAANRKQIQNNINSSMRPYVGQLFHGLALAELDDPVVGSVLLHEDGSSIAMLKDGSGRLQGGIFV